MDIIKAFENNNATMHITIRGTHEEPLFRASDIGEVLEITAIRSVIRDFDNSEKAVHSMHTPGGSQETIEEKINQSALSRRIKNKTITNGYFYQYV